MAPDGLIPEGGEPRVLLSAPEPERPARGPRLTFHGSVLVMTLVALLLMAVPPARQFYREQTQLQAAEQKLATLKQDNARLEGQMARLKDPAYLEKLARQELGVVRPGEIGFVVVPGDAAPKQPAAETKAAPWYQRLVRSLKSVVGAG
jgi:cell division protein FtsB